jgi:hypothetical protein
VSEAAPPAPTVRYKELPLFVVPLVVLTPPPPPPPLAAVGIKSSSLVPIKAADNVPPPPPTNNISQFKGVAAGGDDVILPIPNALLLPMPNANGLINYLN